MFCLTTLAWQQVYSLVKLRFRSRILIKSVPSYEIKLSISSMFIGGRAPTVDGASNLAVKIKEAGVHFDVEMISKDDLSADHDYARC